MTRARRGALALSLIISASLLAGCGADNSAADADVTADAAVTDDGAVTDDAGQVEQDTSDAASDTDDTGDDAAAGDGQAAGEPLTAQEAAVIALDEVPGAVVEIDRDDAGGTVVWEVLVRDDSGNGVEVDVDAATGEVRDRDDEDLPDEAASGAPRVTAVEAMDTAVAEVPGGAVRDLDLSDDDGRIVWDVEVQGDAGRVDVTVDASSGDVLDIDADDGED